MKSSILTINISDINAQLLQRSVSAIKMQIQETIRLSFDTTRIALKNGAERRTATPQTIGSPRLFRLR